MNVKGKDSTPWHAHVRIDAWKWSSYRATAGLVSVPELLTTDWVLSQFGKNRPTAHKRYREFVREGLASRPWEALKGQIYLGSEQFIEKHSPENTELKEIPRVQRKAARPSLERIFAKRGERAIVQAYKEHGYRLHEIAAHLGIHYATVSRKLKQMRTIKLAECCIASPDPSRSSLCRRCFLVANLNTLETRLNGGHRLAIEFEM